MWTYEHAVETSAGIETVWRYWSDVATWPEWNAGVEAVQMSGPFAEGTVFTMTPPGDEPITMRLVEVVSNRSFTDEMDGGDFLVTTLHRLEPLASGGTRIVYRTEISGPAAEQIGPELGPAITADFPEVLAALAGLAEASA
jgi:uncharacterized protein YndB with AHSA1/START domain